MKHYQKYYGVDFNKIKIFLIEFNKKYLKKRKYFYLPS